MKCRMRKGSQFLEYAMLAALIGIVVAAGAMRYGRSLLNLFDSLSDKTAEVTPKTTSPSSQQPPKTK